jgi:hypothetical protein
MAFRTLHLMTEWHVGLIIARVYVRLLQSIYHFSYENEARLKQRNIQCRALCLEHGEPRNSLDISNYNSQDIFSFNSRPNKGVYKPFHESLPFPSFPTLSSPYITHTPKNLLATNPN